MDEMRDRDAAPVLGAVVEMVADRIVQP